MDDIKVKGLLKYIFRPEQLVEDYNTLEEEWEGRKEKINKLIELLEKLHTLNGYIQDLYKDIYEKDLKIAKYFVNYKI